MTFDWSTLALQTVNFAVLVWLLHRFLYKPVLGLIDARRADVETQYARAVAAEAAASAKVQALEAEQALIDRRRTEMIKSATAEAEQAAQARRLKGEEAVSALLAEERKRIVEERSQALAEVRTAALDLGVDIARRFLAEMPIEVSAEGYLEQIEARLAALTPAERVEVRDGAVPGAKLCVATARPLPESVREEWRARLHRALDSTIDMEFETDPALVAGAELHFPTTILRFSWRSALAAMRAEIDADGHAR